MNLTRAITFILGMIITTHSTAQQEPRSSFFWNNYMHTNPAMTGAVYKHHANAQWRNQWVKTNGAPTTLWANYAAKIDKINSGIGASYEYEVIGLTKSHTALLSYAYHLPIKNMFLSLGVSGGIKTLRMEGFSYIFSSQVPGPTFQDRQFNPVFQCDFGIALRSENWNVGLSVTQLNGASFRDTIFQYKNKPHFWVFADYSFQLREKWKLTPRIQSFSDLNRISSSVALLATFKDRLWFGPAGTIPSNGGRYAIGAMVGYDIVGKFRIGYTYDFWLSNYSGLYNDGTHEIILSYQLK